MRRTGKQTGLSDALASLVGRLDRRAGGGLVQVRAAEAWKRVAGVSVTEHTDTVVLKEGQLLVETDSALWATELSALSELYREAMNRELGEEAIRSVRFSVSRHVAAKREAKRAEEEVTSERSVDCVPSVDLSPEERAQVEHSVAGIPDKELREAVLRATVADLEWKKGIAARKAPQTPRGGL